MGDSVQHRLEPQSLDLRQLLQRADQNKGITYGAQGRDRQSYAQLAASAQRIAMGLLAERVSEGDAVIVMISTPQQFLQAFWGCLLAGARPVPLQPGATDEATLKILQVARVLDAPWIISDGNLSASFTRVSAAHDLGEVLVALQARQLNHDALINHPEDAVLRIRLNAVNLGADSTAFIQFSSGSTGDPKGVVLTHRRVLAHLADLGTSCEASADDTFLSWFPLTHDMGMVLMHLLPLALGAEQVQIETKSFVQRPRRWLTRAAELGATVLCTNNFGLKHFLKVTDGKNPPQDDLSGVRLMFNAAEPISAELWETFMTFASGTRLPRAAMYPGYGLADATLAVTVPVPGDGLRILNADRTALGPGDAVHPPLQPRDGIQLVDVGRAIENTSLRIAGADDADLGENRIGEVQLQSRSAAESYLNAPHETLYTADGWLRTGDLGLLSEGRLFIVGRLKEMITLGGENFYPHDIERIAETVPGIELGKVVATSVFDPERQSESLLIFLHARRVDANLASLSRDLQRVLAAQGGWHVDQIVPIRTVPKTSSGKIRRSYLGQQYLSGAFTDAVAELAQLSRADAKRLAGDQQVRTRQVLRLLLASATRVLERTDLDIRKPLVDQGLNSARAMALLTDVGQMLDRDITVARLYDHPTLLSLAQDLSVDAPAQRDVRPVARQPKIAITGIGCRLPGGVSSPKSLMTYLAGGHSAIGPLPDSRAPQGLARRQRPIAAFLETVDMFDPDVFGISWAEAQAMDPQQRLLLEVCWEALERAGISSASRRKRSVGVFVGIGPGEYGQGCDAAPNQYSYTGTAPAIAAGRIAYALGLNGPTMAVDTACSSALVAVHLAVQSLIAGECDTAIAAGVNLILGPDGHAKLQAVSALSPTGHCRAFDDEADGYVRGEGCGAVVLQLAEQIADSDPVVALIAGTALNQDGRSGGLTVPSGPAQSALIDHALARAGLPAGAIGYVETHGTGTPLGDPIEAGALSRVFGPGRPSDTPLLIGSVKTNLGHLESAAGMVGLIKTALCVQSGTLPASLKFKTPNHRINWDAGNLQVVSETRDWPHSDARRCAGVSAFGLSGTNAHVIVEQASQPSIAAAFDPEESGPLPILTFSAATPQALREQAKQLYEYISLHTDLNLLDLCAATAQDRAGLNHIAAGAVTDLKSAQSALLALAEGRSGPMRTGRRRSDRLAQVAFVFTGQGSQWAGMGTDLLDRSVVFAAEIDRIDDLLAPITGWTVRETLISQNAPDLLRRTDRAQAAIFAVQVALARMLEGLGVIPDAVIGHSVGEIAAHHVAGILSLQDAVTLVAHRGTLMQAATGRGRMLAVSLSAEAVAPHLAAIPGLDLAAINSPQQVVLSGDQDAVTAMIARLKPLDIRCADLGVDYAFHGRHVADQAAALPDQLDTLTPAPGLIPLYSTVTGTLQQAKDLALDYWVRNIGDTVRFSDAMAALFADGCTDIVEIGPHPALWPAIASCAEAAGSELAQSGITATLYKEKPGAAALADTLAALTCRGLAPDWDQLLPARRMLPDLPTYPWQRTRFWIDEYDPWAALADGTQMQVAQIYTTATRPLTMPRAGIVMPSLTITHGATDTQGARLAQELATAVKPDHPCRVVSLPEANQPAPQAQDWIVHIAGGVPPDQIAVALSDVASAAQSALSCDGSRLWIVTLDPTADRPGPEPLEALARVMAREHPQLKTTRVRMAGETDLAGLAALLRSDLGDFAEDEIRLDGADLWTERVVLAQDPAATRAWHLKADASYLVTGGTGGIGLTLADWMLTQGAGRVIVTGRATPNAKTLELMQRWNADAVRLEAVSADVTDRTEMAALIDRIANYSKPLRGVIHAAGVLKDGAIHSLTAIPIAEVTEPKVTGGWILHDLTRDLPLDHFVCLSSIAALLGSPGQGAYAGANGGLDALARMRAAQGLPTLSLQLGPMDQIGMAARGAAAQRDLTSLGVTPLSPDAFLDGLERAWNSGLAVAALAEFEAEKWAAHLPDPANQSRLCELQTAQTTNTTPRHDKPQPQVPQVEHQALSRLAALPAPDRPKALIAELAAIIQAVDGRPADTLDPDQTIQDLGISSLTILQIRNEIEARFSYPISVTRFFEFPTIRSFAAHLAETLDFGADPAAAPTPTPALTTTPTPPQTSPKDADQPPPDRLQRREALRSKLEKYR